MGKYLKEFDNHAAYEAAQSGLILPNVSLCVSENGIIYNPYDPYNGHEYVDLGLPSGTKWATKNVMANTITDYGMYYRYGLGANPYNDNQTNYSGTENPLAASADTAVQVWGGQWHMPTQAQFEELIANTTHQWVTDYEGSGKNGAIFTANGQTLFFLAGGDYGWGMVYDIGHKAYYWSSTPHEENVEWAYVLEYNEDGGKEVRYMHRGIGLSIRPVVG